MIEHIKTNQAPEALGHYSQGTIGNGMIFTATQLPIDPANPEKPKGSIEQQTLQVLENIAAVIRAGSGDLDTIMRVTIYVSDISLWDEMNLHYVNFMGKHKPARGVLQVNKIRKGYNVSMDAITLQKGSVA